MTKAKIISPLTKITGEELPILRSSQLRDCRPTEISVQLTVQPNQEKELKSKTVFNLFDPLSQMKLWWQNPVERKVITFQFVNGVYGFAFSRLCCWSARGVLPAYLRAVRLFRPLSTNVRQIAHSFSRLQQGLYFWSCYPST